MQVRIDATCSVVLPKIDSIYYNELIYSQITSHFLYKQSTWQHLSKSVNNKQHYYITLFTHKLDTLEMACNNVNYFRIGSICAQGCQLPDFSLRSQTFCYTADFSATFLYILKTKTFWHIPSQNQQQALENSIILQKISVTRLDKNVKCAPTQLAPPVPGQAF